jgi:hypothetical protein
VSVHCFPEITVVTKDVGYRAQCVDDDCKWHGPLRESRMEANQDGRDHRKDGA